MSTAILLSGGIDSAALACWRRPTLALTVDYGQVSARGELRAAVAIAHALGIAHEVLRVDCRSLGSGTLAGVAADPAAPMVEWWPFRNQLLLTLAGMRAVALGISELLLGTVASDGVFADGRREFFERVDALMAMQEGGVRVSAPASGMASEELVLASGIPLSVLGWTHSCHRGEFACGGCRGCLKHQAVMTGLGFDPP